MAAFPNTNRAAQEFAAKRWRTGISADTNIAPSRGIVPGEIDFIGCDGTTLAFVEVKYRAGTDPWKPRPEDAVDAAKRRNLFRIAGNFLAFRKVDPAAASSTPAFLSPCPKIRSVVQ